MTNSRPTPAIGTLLTRYHFRACWYMATHQCTRFNANPKLCHKRAVKKICKYLLDTKDKEIFFRPAKKKGLKCHVDNDFAVGYTNGKHLNPEAVLSRTGFVISYAGCPIYWHIKYLAQQSQNTWHYQWIWKTFYHSSIWWKICKNSCPWLNMTLSFLHGLQRNHSRIKVADKPQFTPRTKHIALKYHNFRKFVFNGTVKINPIDTLEQTADILTKPLDQSKFVYLRRKLCGWWLYNPTIYQ